MTDAKSNAAQFLMSQHHQICFERGDHPQEVDTAYSLGADALYRANLPPTDAECLRNEKVRELVIDCAASLAAAISLLERGGKKGAASDKMFEQMLKDYKASLDRARTALAALPEVKDDH